VRLVLSARGMGGSVSVSARVCGWVSLARVWVVAVSAGPGRVVCPRMTLPLVRSLVVASYSMP